MVYFQCPPEAPAAVADPPPPYLPVEGPRVDVTPVVVVVVEPPPYSAADCPMHRSITAPSSLALKN